MNKLIETLKENDCKVTLQRIAIYETLKDTKTHPNAETIYKQLSPKYPTISLATVYKSLELFVSLGLIQAINVEENSFRYDGNSKPHPHLICSNCKKVEDLDEHPFSDLGQQVEALSGYQIEKQQLNFYGYCPDCIQKS
ncbi:Fur family transcriptional regulator [Isachenkonia alkalipeptolytica]|uniref:Transcriptional repressor n=1 Tax=Isachenkonia alkalipeptolytica TaxID=2565777 RepID=A0AA44BFR0_9CLOT|nr:transcriptional repressor [Isachenkonia alkalipeptolytica]NBG89175.1 transcriptional repressor [Isachenkonia alkalipeptolytica]